MRPGHRRGSDPENASRRTSRRVEARRGASRRVEASRLHPLRDVTSCRLRMASRRRALASSWRRGVEALRRALTSRRRGRGSATTRLWRAGVARCGRVGAHRWSPRYGMMFCPGVCGCRARTRPRPSAVRHATARHSSSLSILVRVYTVIHSI